MKAEILFPEVCNLYADVQNIRYLQCCCPELETVETPLHTRPAFLDEEVALVYMGSATEKGLMLAVETLLPFKDEIQAKIDGGQLILLTGNAMDAFSQGVDSDGAWHFDGLGLLPGRARYTMMKRQNSFFLGTFDTASGPMDIVGFKSLFGHIYGAPEGNALFTAIRGTGRCPESKEEGFRLRNLMATHLIGPLLILNPPFTKYLMQLMGCESTALAFEAAAFDSYRHRVDEFHQESRSAFYS